jgi:hypothetical protein
VRRRQTGLLPLRPSLQLAAQALCQRSKRCPRCPACSLHGWPKPAYELSFLGRNGRYRAECRARGESGHLATPAAPHTYERQPPPLPVSTTARCPLHALNVACSSHLTPIPATGCSARTGSHTFTIPTSASSTMVGVTWCALAACPPACPPAGCCVLVAWGVQRCAAAGRRSARQLQSRPPASRVPAAGQGHPMKPHRVRMAHSLVLHYGLYSKLEGVRAAGWGPPAGRYQPGAAGRVLAPAPTNVCSALAGLESCPAPSSLCERCLLPASCSPVAPTPPRVPL